MAIKDVKPASILSIPKDYIILSESREHITTVFKDKLGRYVKSTTYMNAYRKGKSEIISKEEFESYQSKTKEQKNEYTK